MELFNNLPDIIFMIFILILVLAIILNYMIINNLNREIKEHSKMNYHKYNYYPKTNYNKDIEKLRFEKFKNEKIENLIYETTNNYKNLDNPNYNPNITNKINNPVHVFRNNDISKWDIKMSSNN